MNNEYLAIYKPSHPKSMTNGMIYEHIIKAEEKLGRSLNDSEVVHHIDENKKNNNYNNLMIFKTQSDHMIFHSNKNFILIDNKDGSYSCKTPERYCEYCSKKIEYYYNLKYCSIECCNKGKRRVERPSAEQLKKDLIETNFVKVGQKYGVSDNAIRKWCKAYKMSTKAKDYK